MRLPTRGALLAVLMVLAFAVTALPGSMLANDDNDNKKKNDNEGSSRQTPAKPTTAKPSGSPQTTSPAGARPDLSITVDGLEPPNVEHTLRFKVTNVGTARSTEVKATIQTVSGGPTNLSDPVVKRLEPGESTVLFYGIGSCDGQVVEATVSDPLDSSSANDRAEKVCAPKPAAVAAAGSQAALSDTDSAAQTNRVSPPPNQTAPPLGVPLDAVVTRVENDGTGIAGALADLVERPDLPLDAVVKPVDAFDDRVRESDILTRYFSWDLKIEYVGQSQPFPEAFEFLVSNVGNSTSRHVQVVFETVVPRPTLEGASNIVPLEPMQSHRVFFIPGGGGCRVRATIRWMNSTPNTPVKPTQTPGQPVAPDTTLPYKDVNSSNDMAEGALPGC